MVKNLIDRDWKEGDAFTFELISQDPELDGRPATVLTVTPENRDDAQLIRTFDQEYTGRTIPYILRERVPDAAVAFDAAGKKLRVQKSAESTTKVDLTYQRYRLMSPEAQAAVVAQAGGAPSWRLDGLLYDTTEHPVEIEVFYDESIQALNTRVNGSLTSEAVKFSNSFTTDNTTARVTVQKEIQNRPWLRAAEETYRFKITPADPGAPMPSADGVRVDEIEIKRGRDVSAPIQSAGFEIEYQWSDLRSPDGTHAESKAFDYVLTEIVPDDAERLEEDGQLVGYMYKRVKYDLTSRTVRVTLKDNGDGTIGTEVTYLSADGEGAEGTDPVPFVNVYEQEDRLTEFPVSITKKVNDSRPVKGSYSFTLLDESKNPLEHLTWQADKADEWGAQLLTVVRDIPCEDVDVDHPKTVTYLLREDIPDDDMGYDAAGNPLNVRFADADGTLKWDETVKWKHQGVTYDSAITEVYVKIEPSKVDYLLHATVKYNQNERTATARNGYESRGEIGFNVNKALTGRAFGEDETFKFTLTPLDGAPALLDETPEAGSETPARFGPLVFDLNQFPDAADGRYGEWSFQYRLGEVIPPEATVTPEGGEPIAYSSLTPEQTLAYDGQWTYRGVIYGQSRIITIHVRDNGDGTLTPTFDSDAEVDGLKAALTLNEETGGYELSYENTYAPSPAEVAFPVAKQIINREGRTLADEEEWKDGEVDWSDESFSFVLKPVVPAGTPMLDDNTVTLDSDHRSGSFDPLRFTEPGDHTYTYTIEEVLPLKDGEPMPLDVDKNLLYDTAVYNVTVEIRDDLEGNLTPTVTYSGPQETPVFRNRWMTETGTIGIRKLWMENGNEVDAPSMLGADPAIAFSLYRLSSDSDQAVLIDGETLLPAQDGEAAPFVLRPDDQGRWVGEISGLKNYESIDGEIVLYSYYVIEDEASARPYRLSGYANDRTTDGLVQSALEVAVMDGGEISVTNSIYIAALPRTGGPGTAGFTAVGIALIVLALALLMRRRA